MRRLFRLVILLGFVGGIVTAVKKRISRDKSPPAEERATPAIEPVAPAPESPAAAATTEPEKVDMLAPGASPEQLAAPHGEADPGSAGDTQPEEKA